MIRLDRVTKVFDTPSGPITAVDDVSLEIERGQICVLLGPSGCGKTTTMKMINRLVQPTSGEIWVDGRDTGKVDPVELRRSIGYVIQQIGLFPNKTIGDNICVVPDLLGWDRRKSRQRAAELLEMVAMDPAVFMNRYPNELSGGQQQRVGVIRALAADPPVMLMDEPFGAIDPINREAIQDEFLRMQAALKKTIIFVSHDLDEAVKMADRIAIFRAGRLEQFATPDRLLANPSSPFVESFLGTDRALKRLRILRVRDVMQTDAVLLSVEDSLAQGRELMAASGLPAMVVVDAQGRPHGIVSESAVANGGGSVREHCVAVNAAVAIEDDLRAAVSTMFAHNLSVVPCVDRDGAVRGVLTFQVISRHLAIPEART